MKKISTLLATAIITSGCALPYERQLEMARNDTTDQLCMIVATEPDYRMAAETELRRRGESCDWQKVQTILQAQSMRNATPAPQPHQIPLPQNNRVSCTSQGIGGGMVRTDCR